MGNCMKFALVVVLLAGTLASAQTSAPESMSGPFEIREGTSFSARPNPKGTAEATSSEPAPSGTTRTIDDIREAYEVIRAYYGGRRATDDVLTTSAVSGMLAELDPHSSYFDSREFAELLADQDSEYSGTGSTIASFRSRGRLETFVLAVQSNSPAQQAGLQYGDRIVAVDGVPAAGLDSVAIRDRVRGPRGSTVELTVERSATGKLETIEMRRDRVAQPTVPNYFMLKDRVGYIDLTQGFSHTTAAEFETAVVELKRLGMRSLVIDLRGNPGGILDSAVKVAEKFLPAGSAIISERGRRDTYIRTFRSANKDAETLPLVVLVDRHTASASEIVAGALQDNDRALILGETTFGKGLVQDVLPLPSGTGMTLTTARYYTPSGRSIQRNYTGVGRYDYFTRQGPAQPSSSSRTLTNRAVQGGVGIVPDQNLEPNGLDDLDVHLLDPIFFFAREAISGRIAELNTDGSPFRARYRQSVIFDDAGADDDEIWTAFQKFVAASAGAVSPNGSDRDRIVGQIRYQLALAAFGQTAADEVRIRSDKQIMRSIALLPKAANLAAAAEKTRINLRSDKKTRRVASPAGQGRNRRN